jgi:RNA polymerase sigma factor (sigma-70 family)
VVWPTAGVGWVASAEDWLDSPYLDRLVTRVASLHLVPAAELPDLIQETRIALWQAGLEAPVSSALVACIARRKSIDLVRELARRRARRRAARILATNQEVDADLHHLLSLKVAALPQRLHEFYELHYEQGLSEREIARSWGLCRASVRWLDRRCRDLLLGIREHLPKKTRISKSD